MLFIVFSIGQLISSDLNILKKGFGDWFSTQNRKTTGDDVWNWMLPNLKPLRTDTISMKQFCDDFNKKFNSGKDSKMMSLEEFETIFKSMATLTESAKETYSQLVNRLQKDGQIKCLLVSHTNTCQFSHILKQLNSDQHTIINKNIQISGIFKQPNVKTPNIPTQNILFCTSMDSKAEMHPDTFNFALKQMGVFTYDSKFSFLSFLDTIKSLENVIYMNPYKEGEKTLDMEHVFKLIKEHKDEYFLDKLNMGCEF